ISSKAGEEDSVIEIESFTKTIDRNLGEMHDLAVDIMEFENENAFIENITMDLIAVADGAEDSPYFPMEGFEIRCPGRTWSEQFDLIPALQNMVKYNMNYVNFKGTYHIDSGYDYFEKQYSFDVSDKNYPRIQPKIVYDKSYGMELDVDPSSGDTVRGIPIQFPLLGQCIYVFHHRYTIEFPVRVQLTDIDSGFTFNFATPIVIENSLPKRYESEFFRSFEYTPSDEDFCANRIYPRTVFIQDAITGDKLSDVDVRYECVRFACDLGKTKQPTFDGIPIYGSVPSLDTAFPPCLNGFLIAEKEGYIGNISQYTVSEAGGTPPPISLTPLKKLFMNVVVVELEDGLGIRPLAKDEIAVIFVYDEKHNYEDAFYYPPTKFVKDRLELIYDDAEYELDIKLVKNNTVIGGYYLPEWSLRRSELSTSSEVVFTVFTKPSPPKTNDEFAGFWNNDVLKNSKDFLPAVR
ncbi:hypothetical protein KY316_03365, partial [Candidatus Woesearchaeota archaeon]|nr:hypothetical protein [Candidatus Woesearchaeota archaeon]